MVRLALALVSLALAGCASTPLELTLPDGQVLSGSATRAWHRGNYSAGNGKVTCSGGYEPSVLGGDMDVRLLCSNGLRGEGSGQSGQGLINLSNGQTASFRYGDAVRADKR